MFQALQQADYNLGGDITAKDIVDGHREKTLSLLWQIIYKFRSPRFNSAASSIQLWWRKKWLCVYINRRIQQKHEEKQKNAAIVIQKWFRGYYTRKQVQVYMETRLEAVVTIQRNLKMVFAEYFAFHVFHGTIVE